MCVQLHVHTSVHERNMVVLNAEPPSLSSDKILVSGLVRLQMIAIMQSLLCVDIHEHIQLHVCEHIHVQAHYLIHCTCTCNYSLSYVYGLPHIFKCTYMYMHTDTILYARTCMYVREIAQQPENNMQYLI